MGPCHAITTPFRHVKFMKCPCRCVTFSGLDPYQKPKVIDPGTDLRESGPSEASFHVRPEIKPRIYLFVGLRTFCLIALFFRVSVAYFEELLIMFRDVLEGHYKYKY